MQDILTQRAPCATEPRPHPAIDAIIAAGRAATELRNQHHAESRKLRRQATEARGADPAEPRA